MAFMTYEVNVRIYPLLDYVLYSVFTTDMRGRP